MALKPGETMIPVSKATRDKLKDIGKKGDTYDTIIRKLIEGYENPNKK